MLKRSPKREGMKLFPGYLLLCKHSQIGFFGMQSFGNEIRSGLIKQYNKGRMILILDAFL